MRRRTTCRPRSACTGASTSRARRRASRRASAATRALRTVFPDRRRRTPAAGAGPLASTAGLLTDDELQRGRARRGGRGPLRPRHRRPAARHAVRARRHGEHVLVLVMHHIAGDGWSTAPLLRDLAERLRRPACAATRPGVGAAAGAVRRLRALAARTARCRGRRGQRDRRQLAYWRAHAGRPADELSLPSDRPRPPLLVYRGDVVAFARRRRRCTRGCAGIARQTAEHAVHGAPGRARRAAHPTGRGHRHPARHAGRRPTDEALDDLVGFFVNTLVLRTDTSGDPTFRELLAGCGRPTWPRTRTRTCRSSGWSRRSTRPRRRPATRCSRSCSCCRTRPDGDAAAARPRRSRPSRSRRRVAKFDLTFDLTETPATDRRSSRRGWSTAPTCSTGSTAGAGRRAGCAAARPVESPTPDRPIGQIDVLTAGERERAARVHRDRRRAAGRRLPELFEDRCAGTRTRSPWSSASDR